MADVAGWFTDPLEFEFMQRALLAVALVGIVSAVIGVRRWKVHVPVPLVWPAAWMMERLLARPLITMEQLRLLEVDSVAELGLVERAFGFHPTSLRDGLAYLQKRA